MRGREGGGAKQWEGRGIMQRGEQPERENRIMGVSSPPLRIDEGQREEKDLSERENEREKDLYMGS